MPCSTDEQNQAHNTHLREPFVMQDNPDMDYSMLWFDECARCRQFEPDYDHKNCSFKFEHKDDISIQTFECTRCHFNWIRKYKHENSINN